MKRKRSMIYKLKETCIIEKPFSRFLKRAGWRSLHWIWRHFLLEYSETQILNFLLRPRQAQFPGIFLIHIRRRINCTRNGAHSRPCCILLNPKNKTGDNVLFQNWYALGGLKKVFKPHLQNRISVTLSGFFKIFDERPRPYYLRFPRISSLLPLPLLIVRLFKVPSFFQPN